ncbi:MAG: type IX secretion system protein PorQ [Cyclobacteriaceae bacterium]|nr:type IX secretion system protein PorQ [Cyclobacteriaceae bacterium]MDW8330506.1 type IX secretion system protein PorQ [Cyclobacteriaceae bacterium]
MLLLIAHAAVQSQTVTTYSFLRIPPHARLQALGGENISEADRDVNYMFTNPALVGDSLSGNASVGYLFYLADIGQSTAAYAHTFPHAGTLLFGFRHVNYGSLEGYDNTGAPLGTFRSSDTELVIGKTMQSGVFRFGLNIKGIFSNLAGFRSTALLTDAGGAFIHPNKRLTIALAFRNLGLVVNDFSPSANSTLPFDVQAGTTFQPEHMPVRFSFTITRLTRPGKIFDDPALTEEPSVFKKAFTHITTGAEILIHKNITILAGFNALRQYELGRGFSAGVAVAIRNFNLVIGNTTYARGTGSWAFTVSTNTRALWTTGNL